VRDATSDTACRRVASETVLPCTEPRTECTATRPKAMIGHGALLAPPRTEMAPVVGTVAVKFG